MVRIGIVGIGFMGYTHFEAAQRLRGAKITAIATRDVKKLAGDWTSIQGNFGPRAGTYDLSNINLHEDYRDLLNDPEVDLVDICLPTNLHEKVALAAIKAGKAVLVEKPISIDLKAADRIVKAAEKAGTILMVAHVLPFMGEFQFAAECITSGKYGKMVAAHFRRVIAQPDWSKEMADFRNLGGWGVDLHIHDNHFISHVCGVPNRVFAQGLMQDDLVNHVHSQYLYDKGPVVSCVSGGIAAKGLQFSHGFEIYLEKATLLYNFGTIGGEPTTDRPLTVITSQGKVHTPKLKGGAEWCGGFTAELQMAVNGMKKRETPSVLSGSLARDALKLCHAEAKSITTGKVVKVN